MAKLSRYASPEWQTNPFLAQVQEALAEVEHLRDTLKTFEEMASGVPMASPKSKKFVRDVINRGQAPLRLYGWLVSLNESFVGLHYLLSERSLTGVSQAQGAVQALIKDINAADFKWKAMKLAAIAAAEGKKVADAMNKEGGIFGD